MINKEETQKVSQQYKATDHADELNSGDYVRDTDDFTGEVFVMTGDPSDRRVRIEDRSGRGWNIAPWRLVPVALNDPAIGKYFG